MSQNTLLSTTVVEPADLQVILAAWTEATDRLQKTHELLQAEVSRLTDELELKNKELARRNRLADLGQMASHIAHEVRNGLLPMKLYLSLLRRKVGSQEEAVGIVDKVTAGVGALETIVNDLLHFSADRDGQPAAVDCRMLFEEIVESLGGIDAEEARVRLGTLTYPNRPFGERGNVPILGPVGAALIGMHRNSTIEWLDEGRTRTLTVLDYGW